MSKERIKQKKKQYFHGPNLNQLERNIQEAIDQFGWQEVEQTITSNTPQWVILVEYFEKK